MLINRIQDRRGKTIFSSNFAKCKGCDRYNEDNKDEGFPKIDFNNKQIISEQTAYQMTSILKGVLQEELEKNLEILMFQ